MEDRVHIKLRTVKLQRGRFQKYIWLIFIFQLLTSIKCQDLPYTLSTSENRHSLDLGPGILSFEDEGRQRIGDV